MVTRWSTAEDQLLRRLYADQLPVEQIAGRLARSPDAVVAHRQALGIAPRRPSRPWSPREEALLRAGSATGLPAPLLAQRLGRSTQQVRARRRTLVAPPPPARPYLAHEDKAIRVCLAERGDLVALGRRLGRSPDAVRLHAQQLGIYRPTPRGRRWTDWEDALIRDRYTSALGCAQIARQLPHRSAASVPARARKLGLATYARRWSIQDDQRLAQLTARGATLEDVAQRLGRTPEAIRRRAARLGAKPPRPAPAPRRARHWTLRGRRAAAPASRPEPRAARRAARPLRRRRVPTVMCAGTTRQRSALPPSSGQPTETACPGPGERAVIERALAHATPRRRVTILRRLDYSSGRAHPRTGSPE